jgi:hypothetical protein
MDWQRANIQAAAAYLRQRIGDGETDARMKIVYEGLLDVLEPKRRVIRVQREAAESAKAAVAVQAERDRRRENERRHQRDRRAASLGPPSGVERRVADRRAGRDRRSGRS